MFASFNSLFDLMAAFPDEQTCVNHFHSIRCRDGKVCPLFGCNCIFKFSDSRHLKVRAMAHAQRAFEAFKSEAMRLSA